MKKLFVVAVLMVSLSTGGLAAPSVAQSVKELRSLVNQVAKEVEEGDQAGAVAAAEEAYETWSSLPPLVRRTIEKANPGTEQKLADLDEEAVAQIEADSDESSETKGSEDSSGTTVNYTPRPVARYAVAKDIQENQSSGSNSQTSSQVTTVTTANGTAVAGGGAHVTTSQNGNTSSAQTTAAGAAYNPATGRWAAAAHQGQANATQNADGSYDTSHSGQTAVATSEGGGTVSHSGSGDDLGSGSGSYTSSTSVETTSGQSYHNSQTYENSTDIFGSSGLGQSSAKSTQSASKKSSKQRASSSGTSRSGTRGSGRKGRRR